MRPGLDTEIIDEVFQRKLYDIKPGVKVNSVLDLGSNIGTSVIFFASKFPEAKIVCFEPVKENADLLRKNVDVNGLQERVEIHEEAVHDKTGKRDIGVYGKTSVEHSKYRTQAPSINFVAYRKHR